MRNRLAGSVPVETVERRIWLLRGQKVMLDSDLAELYEVPTFRLNEQVKRNIKRFPPDFMFQLVSEEAASLRSQFAILKDGRGKHRKYLPYAFTEQGVAMLSSVLRSERAIEVNIAIMRTFLRLRQVLTAHKELAEKLVELERQVEGHGHQIHSIFEAIRRLMAPARRPHRRIGFHAEARVPGLEGKVPGLRPGTF